MNGLSVSMIVKNEADNIADALADFTSFADEIIVVDTGSTDNTKEIAARFTTKIYDFEWFDDFSAARNFAMSKAAGSYQLWVDADDRITPENQGHIESLKSHFDGKRAFYFVLQTHKTDSPSTSCLQLRCTPLIPEMRFEGRIHEQLFPSAVRVGLEMVPTDIVIAHHGYVDESIRSAKVRRNLGILQKERAEGRDDGALHFFLAMTYGALDNRAEAMSSMEKALERFEKEYCNHHLIPEGYLFLARNGFEMGDYDSCRRYLAVAGSLAEGNPLHNFRIGILYQRMGRHYEALEALKDVCGKSNVPGLFPTQPLPAHSELLLHMAYSHYCMNDRQNALKMINSSAPQGQDTGKSWEWLGAKAYLLENFAFAHIAFETALRFGPLEPVNWARLGSIYKMRGLSGRAQECLDRAGIKVGNPPRQGPS